MKPHWLLPPTYMSLYHLQYPISDTYKDFKSMYQLPDDLQRSYFTDLGAYWPVDLYLDAVTAKMMK